MTERFFTNADLRESRADWLRGKYEEDENGKTVVAEIVDVVQNKYEDLSREECGKIVRVAFPNSKRKRHHSGTNYFYQGIKKRKEDENPLFDETTSQLQFSLHEAREKNVLLQSSLEEMNDRFEEKQGYCAELESKLHSERKTVQDLTESKEKIRAEIDATIKKEALTAQKLHVAEDKLHLANWKLARYKKHVRIVAEDKPRPSYESASLDLTVIPEVQLTNQGARKKLGSGTFGDCYLMKYRNIDVCVKYCGESSYNSVVKEAKFIRQLEGHPNLPLLFGVSMKNQTPPYIVTKFHGDSSTRKNTLHNAIYSKKADYTPKCFLELALQCGRGLMHIHNKGILHNDLKCNNVLVDIINGKPCAVIIDFGKSCFVKNAVARIKHIPRNEREDYKKNYPHIAPELADMSRSQSFASDIYSYGMLLRKVSTNASSLAVAAEKCVVENPEKRASLDNVISLIGDALKCL